MVNFGVYLKSAFGAYWSLFSAKKDCKIKPTPKTILGD